MKIYRHLLVPIDDTPLGARLVEQAVELARADGARLTFLHVEPDDSSGADAALLRALSPALYAAHAVGRAPVVLGRAAAAARAASLASEGLAARSPQPHEAILRAAREQRCDLVVMASHGRRGLKGIRLGSVTQKVLQHATLPVLVVAVESNLPMSDEQRAIAAIRAEHRSIAAVIDALRHAWHAARAAGGTPDYRLLRAMLYYIVEFPERLHHPKEEEHLFRRLRSRTREQDALIEQLEGQHVDGAERFAALRQALDQAERGSPEGFDAALESYARAQWAHMAAEERHILPAAGEHLEPDDWAAIARAFEDNRDPRFGADADESFEQLFDRLLRLAASS